MYRIGFSVSTSLVLVYSSLYISFQLLIALHACPQNIAEFSFIPQAQTELRKRNFLHNPLYFPGIVIFSDKSQGHVQIPGRNIVSLHALLFQIMHTAHQGLFHLRRQLNRYKKSHDALLLTCLLSYLLSCL